MPWEELVKELRDRTTLNPEVAEMHLAVAEQIRLEDEGGAIAYLKSALEQLGDD